MSRYGDDLLRYSLELAARQWTTLGVALAGSHHDEASVIDPEALILFTACLGDADVRLRDESTDWCVAYGTRLISASRLRNLRTYYPPDLATIIDEYVATVNEHASTRWQTSSDLVKPRRFQPSGKSRLPKLPISEALLLLQLRALFGVTARAEILLHLATTRPKKRFLSAADLASTGYSKRNVAIILENLALSELVSARKVRNRIEYRLAKESHLLPLVPATAKANRIRWDVTFPLLSTLRQLDEQVANRKPIIRSLAARQFVDTHSKDFDVLDLSPPGPSDPTTYFETMMEWARDSLVPVNSLRHAGETGP